MQTKNGTSLCLLMKFFLMYKIIFFDSKNFRKDLKKLNKSGDKKKVEKKMIQLSSYPFLEHLDIKKLKGKIKTTFRLKIGNWRIFYDVDSFNQIIIVSRIKPRKSAY